MLELDRRSILVGMTSVAAVAFVATQAPSWGRVADGVRPNLYNCEGCQAVAERSPVGLGSRVALAAESEPGERMTLTGRVLGWHRGTPVGEVVVYAHHTNADGLYANGANESEWSRRHGCLRGWAKTGSDGVYTFETIKPAPYPNNAMPAHVHLFIGEPGRPAYYIDDVVFDGEFGVTTAYRRAQELRGGSGIVRLARSTEGVLLARRDIRLERHA